MTFKKLILISTLFALSVNVFGQDDRKRTQRLTHEGFVDELNMPIDDNYEIVYQDIKERLSAYPIVTNTEFRKEKGDTLIEIVSFNKDELPSYSYYHNNLLKIQYDQLDSNEYVLTIMNEVEIEQKRWVVAVNELHAIDYDYNGLISRYYAEIYHDSDTKIEFEKEWNGSKFKYGKSKTYVRETDKWKMLNTKKLSALDWPQTKKTHVFIDSVIEATELIKIINSSQHSGELVIHDRNDTWLEENTDSTSFLPLKLKEGLETGRYQIYRKISKKWEFQDLLIDAVIVNGKLHGVYNEYDISTGKIKIYCVYNHGKLHGRRTIYHYMKDGKFDMKKTELWDNGKLKGVLY